MMLLFYQAALESLLRYGMMVWQSPCGVKSKTSALKIIGQKQHKNNQSIFDQCVSKQTDRKLLHPSCPGFTI